MSLDSLHPRLLSMFVRSLAMLALPAPAQIAWLEDSGLPDIHDSSELALDVNEGILLLDQFIAMGWVPAVAEAPLRDIDEFFADRSGKDHSVFWDVASLSSHPGWERVRAMAQRALREL